MGHYLCEPHRPPNKGWRWHLCSRVARLPGGLRASSLAPLSMLLTAFIVRDDFFYLNSILAIDIEGKVEPEPL